MAGDEEVEAAWKAHREAAHGGTWMRLSDAEYEAIGRAYLDRVRSRPAGSTTSGTEGEDHEAEIKRLRMQRDVARRNFRYLDERVAQLEEAVKTAVQELPATLVDSKPSDYEDGPSRAGARLRLALRAIRSEASPVSGTEPDTAKLVEALHRLNVDWDDVAATCGDPRCAGDCRHVATVRAFLAGFSVDAGKPCPEQPVDPMDKMTAGEMPRLAEWKKAGPDGR